MQNVHQPHEAILPTPCVLRQGEERTLLSESMEGNVLKYGFSLPRFRLFS